MLRPGLTFFYRLTTPWTKKLDQLMGLCNAFSVFLVCGILLGGGALAAPPNPPVFLGEDVIVVGNNANRINAILDAYAVPDILSGLRYPADPVTTTTHEVRNNAELTAAVSGDGRLVRIYGPSNGGLASYNQFNPGARSDLDIVMDNDATVSGPSGWAWFNPLRRFRWTGGNIDIAGGDASGFRIADAEDVLFDDVRMTRDGSDGHIFLTQGNRHLRIAVINTTMEFTASGAARNYAMYSAGDPTYRGDWVLLNNRFIGQGPPVRLMFNGLRTAIVGNYFSEFPNAASIRIHEDCDKLWFAHNVSVHGGGNQQNFDFVVSGNSVDVSSIMNDVVIEDNRLFATRSNINSGGTMRLGDIVEANRSQATNWVIRGNTWSDPTGPVGGDSHGYFLITVPYVAENNLRVGPGHPSYETVPAASGFGAGR